MTPNTHRRPHLAALMLCGIALIGLSLLGCVADPTAPPADPFGCDCSSCDCPPGQCPAACPGPLAPGGGSCPDGICPTDATSPAASGSGITSGGGIEIGGSPLAPVNTVAQSEAKGGCTTCPQFQPVATPSAAAPSAAKTSPLDEPKTGQYACQSCRRHIVGRDWHVIWTDDGRSIMAICNTCNDRLAPQARERILREYLRRGGLDPDRDASLTAAITGNNPTR